MPIYEFKCGGCHEIFEKQLKVERRNLRTCPFCKEKKVERLIGTGGTSIFKGEGWTPRYHA